MSMQLHENIINNILTCLQKKKIDVLIVSYSLENNQLETEYYFLH